MINLMLDYHAHVLPKCDHGCGSVMTALWQLNEAKKAGVRTVIATPHYYPHRTDLDTFLKLRAHAYDMLMDRLPAGSPRVIPGAEVLICSGLERMDGLTELCRTNTRELLLEMPFYGWTADIRDTLYELLDRRDIDVVLAHVDRYPHEEIEKLIRQGVSVQLNASAFTHPLRRQRYYRWIREGAVRYIGSDIHRQGNHYEDFAKAKKLIRAHAPEQVMHKVRA